VYDQTEDVSKDIRDLKEKILNIGSGDHYPEKINIWHYDWIFVATLSNLNLKLCRKSL
jgi:hypothetical protein